jgi:hypothetical protein
MEILFIIILILEILPYLAIGAAVAYTLKRLKPGVIRAVSFFILYSVLSVVTMYITVFIYDLLFNSALFGIVIGYLPGMFLAIHMLSKWDIKNKLVTKVGI